MARPIKQKEHLFIKRQELVWALDLQGYNGEDIGTIFGVTRFVVSRILKEKPRGWEPKWVKVRKKKKPFLDLRGLVQIKGR